MIRPVEIHFHDVPHSDALEEHIRELAGHLDRFHSNITACVVHLEQPHRHRSNKAGFRVGIEVVIPHQGELTVSKSSDHHEVHDNFYQVVDEAFEAMVKRLKRITAKARGEVKHHPAQEVQAVVKQLFAEHGFLRTHEGHDVYFHRNSVLNTPFEELKEGMGVSFSEEQGEMGPQASTVRVLMKEPVPLRPHKQ